MVKLDRFCAPLPWLVALALLCAFPVRGYEWCLDEACAHSEASVAVFGASCEDKSHCFQCMARGCQGWQAPELIFFGKQLVSTASPPPPAPEPWANPFLLPPLLPPSGCWTPGANHHLLALSSVQMLC